MGWQSGLLGGNVVSSYLHVDNLRNDLVSGKFWNATDGSETTYLQISHDGNDGIINSSAGAIRMNGGAGGVMVEDAGGGQYVSISHNGSEADILSSSGPVRMGWSGVSVLSSDGAKQLLFSHDGTNGVVNSNNGMLVLVGGADNRRVQIGSYAIANIRFRMKDNFTGAWVRAYVHNGAWVIESDS